MKSGALILVIDDDPYMREITRVHLEGAGYEVALAATAADGLHKARSLRPSVVIMDFAMPGGSGAEALRDLRNDHAIGQVPVLMVTAWSLEESQAKTAEFGATWLQKPIMAERLIDSVRELAAV